MTIQYLGLGAIKIKSQQQTILIDPPSETLYAKRWRLKPDILLLSSALNQPLKGIMGDPFIIQYPGEYQVKDLVIYGLEANTTENKDIIPYYLEIEEMKILHLGAIKENLSERQMSQLGEIDILFIPVGGNIVLDDEKASKFISEIEPEIVIPLYYQIPKLKTQLAPISKFCEEMGSEEEYLDKLTIKKKDVQAEETKIVLLKVK